MWETQRRGRGWLGLGETRYTSGTHQPTAIGSDGGLKQFVQRHDGQDDGEDQWGRRKKGQILERGARLEWERRIEAPRVRTDSKNLGPGKLAPAARRQQRVFPCSTWQSSSLPVLERYENRTRADMSCQADLRQMMFTRKRRRRIDGSWITIVSKGRAQCSEQTGESRLDESPHDQAKRDERCSNKRPQAE